MRTGCISKLFFDVQFIYIKYISIFVIQFTQFSLVQNDNQDAGSQGQDGRRNLTDLISYDGQKRIASIQLKRVNFAMGSNSRSGVASKRVRECKKNFVRLQQQNRVEKSLNEGVKIIGRPALYVSCQQKNGYVQKEKIFN